MKTRLAGLFAVAVLLGCTAEFSEPKSGAALYRSAAPAEVAEQAPAFAAVSGVEIADEHDLPMIRMPDASHMIIRTATALIEVDSLESAVAELRQLAARVGGYVANTGMEVGRNRLRQAVIEVKIPANRFDEVLSGLKPIGTLESVNVTAQDVGEEYVDVGARIENAKRLERRLIDLLATRTGKLKDVLDVEQELARVREEIERYQGRIRFLEAHTATSTLSVTAHEPVPIVATAGRGPIGEAFRQSWRNFVTLLSFAVQSLGVVVPLGLLALMGWFIAKRSRRLWSQRTPA